MNDPWWMFFGQKLSYQFDQAFPGLEPVGELEGDFAFDT